MKKKREQHELVTEEVEKYWKYCSKIDVLHFLETFGNDEYENEKKN